MPARLSSSLNQPPIPTKAAIAVREIVGSTAQKAGLVSQPCRYPGGTRRFIRGRNRVSAVFTEAVPSFSSCTASCCFCQNYQISSEGWKDISKRVWGNFLELQAQGAQQYQSATPTQYLPSLLPVLTGQPQLSIPIVNCGGYETLEAVDAGSLYRYLAAGFKILLFCPPATRCPPDYFPSPPAAVNDRAHRSGWYWKISLKWSDLPAHEARRDPATWFFRNTKDDSIRLLHWIHDNLPEGIFW